jgi:hypothetical protein
MAYTMQRIFPPNTSALIEAGVTARGNAIMQLKHICSWTIDQSSDLFCQSWMGADGGWQRQGQKGGMQYNATFCHL